MKKQTNPSDERLRWRAVPYEPCHREDWDALVRRSKNGTFLLTRNYMEYHSHRFCDASLLLLRDGRLEALLPGCLVGDGYVSHGGLTYGGLIVLPTATYERVEAALSEAVRYISQTRKVKHLEYRAIPYIYHRLPAGEDLYALFRLGAVLKGRKISSVVARGEPARFRELRKRGLRRALAAGLSVTEDSEYSCFWPVLEANLLTRHGVAPVHSTAEIEKLSALFPGEISLFRVVNQGETVGGCVVFDTPCTAHVQYIASTPGGRRDGALDLLFSYLISDRYADKLYFDFGVSTEQEGRVLNRGLLFQKEGFGAAAVMYDVYELPIDGHVSPER